VWANQLGDSQATYEGNGSATVTLTGCTTASLSPPSVAQPAGAPINFTASSSGGCPSPQYQFWVGYPNGTWVMKQNWGGPNFTLITAGLPPGMYSVHVWANQAGASQVKWEANGSAAVALDICTSAALIPTSQSAAAGTMVPLSATSTDCLSPHYEYWVQYLNGTWHLARSWGVAGFSWSSAGLAPGTYTFHVWANNTGDSTATWEAFGNGTVTLVGCTLPGLTSDLPSPQNVGQTINFTATSATCPTPIYEFWLQYPDGTWHLMQTFTPGGATWQWKTTGFPKGNYVVRVWANNKGSDTSTFDVYASESFTLQ
jgi:hypothetical protein